MNNTKQPTENLSDDVVIFCGARTRKGIPCENPPEHCKRRCRLHGGAPGSGAPIGNQNAVKHGLYAKDIKQLRQEVKNLTKNCRKASSFEDFVKMYLDIEQTNQL